MTSDPVAVAFVRSFDAPSGRSRDRAFAHGGPRERSRREIRRRRARQHRRRRRCAVEGGGAREGACVCVYVCVQREIGLKRRVLCNWSPMDFLLYLERRS